MIGRPESKAQNSVSVTVLATKYVARSSLRHDSSETSLETDCHFERATLCDVEMVPVNLGEEKVCF